MSSTLENLGGSSSGYHPCSHFTFLPFSTSSTMASSTHLFLEAGGLKATLVRGTHTSFLAAQSAWASGVVVKFYPHRDTYQQLAAPW